MAGGKENARQKMINLMYLVFIAMLALNMSKEVLATFGVIQNEVQLNNPIIEKGVTLEEAEKQLIVRTIKECRGNRTAAAKKVGISRRTLHRKLHRYGLEGI